ncbi:MAG: alcohol dehydrogenase catalytic domain-containing protein [Caldilineales bacterium]|nr:alcohol dehydrogenase catalytic domain-containing protein [Caldilineales bacterium]
MTTATSTTPANLMQTMQLHAVRDIRPALVPRPTPGPGEVLLQVASVGVCGSDVHYYLHGRIGDQIAVDPIIMGHEFSTYVVELGKGVDSLTVGQLVAVEPAINCGHCEPCLTGHPNLCPNVRFCGTPQINGAMAEYIVMPAHNCFPLPDGFSPVDGAMLEPLGVAIHTVDLAHLKIGQTIAVLGAGPIGLLIAAVAKAAGAGQILMTEPLAYRRQFASDYIADEVFDPTSEDVVAAVLRATHGRGVDVAFEAAGEQLTPQQGADMLRPGGKLVLCGIPANEDRLTLTASVIRRKAITIIPVRRMKHTYPRAIRMVQTGMVDLAAIATHFMPLADVPHAFEIASSYDDGVLRAIIQVSEQD